MIKTILDREAKAALREKEETQKIIREKFGDAKIEEIRQEVCLNGCVYFYKCDLLPLTLKGEICPYRVYQ